MPRSTPHRIDLVIFDCDGVLIDSEMLSAAVLMQLMDEVGLPITPEIFRSDFLGRSFASAAARVEKRFGKPFPPDFNVNYRARLLAQMKGNLHAMPGVEALLQAMCVPYCLATSSSPQRLAVAMAESGLAPWFEGKSFTASEVANGKPAPDLFLHACRMIGHSPANTLVIEDSDIGISAGLAAGMTVWQFAGGSHLAGQPASGAATAHRRLDSMAALHDAFREWGLAR